jgi:hypothetical protein
VLHEIAIKRYKEDDDFFTATVKSGIFFLLIDSQQWIKN